MSSLADFLGKVLSLDFAGIETLSVTAIFFLFFFATFVTEDGACLAAGALAGQGRVSLSLAISACFFGIVVGDVGLYAIGRVSGTALHSSKLFRRFVSIEALETASDWLEQRGATAIFISRFVAGLRLPTYLAAGFLKTNFLKFLFYFLVAAAVWTPAFVGAAAYLQKFVSPKYILLSILALYIALHFAFNLSTRRRRRLLLGRLKRISNWEFWPLAVFYAPVVIYILLLAVKHRSITVFTCANPSIPGGGFVGESKEEIYRGLEENGANSGFMLQRAFLEPETDPDKRLARAKEALESNRLSFPLVVKPDAGERGKGVKIAGSLEEFETVVVSTEKALIIQEFVDGPEISVFAVSNPETGKTEIFSATKKSMPFVIGDGIRTLEDLILDDPRAVAIAGKYFEANAQRLHEIPKPGEKVRLVQIGTHSRGAVFLEGEEFATPDVESAIEGIVRNYEGFYFGRFDLRAEDEQAIKEGRFKIIELNGVTSESTNIYDPRYGLLDAYSILFRQWSKAFEIGDINYKAGCSKTRLRDLFKPVARTTPKKGL